jgi:membrane protease YdiL (CAAX protease family)
MIPLYTGVGLYLWVVVAATGSLAAAMVTHGAYNFLAILMIRHKAVGLR